MYPYIKKYVDYLSTRTQDRIIRFGLGDWAPAKTKTPVEITSTAYYYVDAVLAAKMAGMFGYEEDQKEYTALATRIRDAFNKQFYRGNGIYDEGSQAGLACALYQGLSGEYSDETINALVSAVRKTDDHLDCGILGTKYLLHALSDNGRSDIAYKIVNQRSFPGWGYWMDQGATTLWEQWDGSESRNHIMFGDVSAWFYKNLAGIAPHDAQPGFKLISFRPYFSPELKWVKASHQSMYGEIKASWIKKGNSIHYSISIPANTTGEIVLPKDKKLFVNGKALSKYGHINTLSEGRDETKFALGSGDYLITIK
jgi:alpha-L-rhamnosidase